MRSLFIATLCIAAALLCESAAAADPPPGAASHLVDGAPMPLTEDEALPPVGKGNLFSDAQVRYCLAQLIRVDAVRPLLNRYAREEVEQFNALVADFNARCGSYRYKDNALDEAKAWREENQAQIEQTARENYLKRFPGEGKVAQSPKKPVAAAAPGKPNVTASARALSEPTAAQPAAKPAPPAEQKPTPASKPPIDRAKPASVAPRPLPGRTEKPAQTAGKPPSDTGNAASETLPAAKPPEAGAEIPKAAAPTARQPSTARADTSSETVSTPPVGPAVTKPQEPPAAAAERAAKPAANASAAPTTPQSMTAYADTTSTAAPTVTATPAEPLISKPKEFPVSPADVSTSSPPAGNNAPGSAAAKPTRPPPADKPAKPADVATTTAKPAPAAEPAVKAKSAQSDQHEPSTAGGAGSSAKPVGKPPRQPESTARKTDPPAQVAAVAPKPEAPASADAALTRLTKEIQRAGSQVLPQPAGASDSNTDLTTQVEVRYATGGWVRSIVVGESSGSAALDEQALASARATRFPDVPEELRSRDFTVRFPVVFRAAR